MDGATYGPYRLIRELGTGATASVWLAQTTRPVQNLAPGANVAVKVLHKHWEEGSSVHDRFLLEAQAGRLVLHPNVVRVLDAGVAELDGRPRTYLAMEVAEGQTLRDLIEEGGGQPETLCRHIATEAALGLAAIHRAGMVHRDVKPENVMLASDGRVKIMDLGVAQLRDATARVTRSGDFFGSMLYAAPEQVGMGSAALDGRTDLYALGWVLYELATGAHPLDGLDIGAMLQAQIRQAPPTLGEVRPETTPFFESLVAALLEKNVDARPSDSNTLAGILEHGERSSWWQARLVALPEAGTAVRRRVKRRGETALHGRDPELAALQRAWASATAGDGGAVLVSGEAGVGKSRLVEEFLERVVETRPATPILHGLYPPSAAASPGSAIRDAYRDHLGFERLDATLGDLLGTAPQLVAPFAAYLRGELAPETSQSLPPDAMVTAFLRVAQALASREPTVIVVEDLHFAAAEDRALFQALARGAPSHPLLLVGATRPDVDAEWLEALTATPGCSQIDVDRLGDGDVRSLLAERLHSERAAAEIAPFLGEASDGNPFFLFELLRGMEEEGVLHSRPDGRWTVAGDPRELSVPEAVRVQIESRLRRLTPEDRATVDAAAMCGASFEPPAVARLLGEPTIDVLRRLARLERLHGLVHARGSKIVFDHHQVQETLYEALPAPLRMEYHRMLAELLLEEAPESGDRDVRVCEHFLAAEQGKRALPHLEGALAYLDSGNRNNALATLLGRVLGTSDLIAADERVRLRLQHATCLDVLGRKQAARAAIDEALAAMEGLGNPGLEALALLEHGKDLQRAGSTEAAVEPLTRAISLAAAAGDVHTESEAHGARGVVFELSGRLTDAEADQRRRLELAWKVGDKKLEAAARGNLAQILWYRSEFGLAMDQFHECRRLFAEAGDTFSEARAASNLGLALNHAGRVEEAQEQFARALAVYRDVGYRRGEANATGNLALTAVHHGRLAEGLDYARQTLELQREVGNARDQAIALEVLAGQCLAVGRIEEARIYAEEGLRLAGECGYRLGEGTARVVLAGAVQGQGDTERSETLDREALAIYESLGAKQYVSSARMKVVGKAAPERRALLETLWAADPDEAMVETRLTAGFQLADQGLVDPEAVRRAYREAQTDLAVLDRMEMELRLWRLTADRAHLCEARDLLEYVLRHAPEGGARRLLQDAEDCRSVAEALREVGEPVPAPIG